MKTYVFVILSTTKTKTMAYMNLPKEEVVWSDGKIYERQPCLTFGRVMGYLAPTINFNKWKLSERFSRARFTQEAAENSAFIKKYLVAKPCCHVD